MIPLLDAFDRRLDPVARSPVAVAYSGGGDSLMALLLTKAWAERHDRPVVALTVDHGLQAASSDWTRFAGQTAERLGAGFRALIWTGERPRSGLADAARTARHRLIAEAARRIGARVVVLGHTADDLLETELMREEGLRLGQPREWSPSPAWPEGRGIFLLRPLLGVRRAAIREALAACGERWIDDPANTDPTSPRARARARVRPGKTEPLIAPVGDAGLVGLALEAAAGSDGALGFDRDRLRTAAPAQLHRLLAAALTSAGGAARPPRRVRVEALATRLAGAEPFTATLAGAKLLARETVLIVRDAGEFRRRSLEPLALAPYMAGVWDGRFEVSAGAAPLTVQTLAGRSKALATSEQASLRTLPAAVRPSLPLFELGQNAVTCPILAEVASTSIKSLVAERFLSACGVYSREAAT